MFYSPRNLSGKGFNGYMAIQCELTASNIRYLLVMKGLENNKCGVRCVDIANALGKSKPSVHNMMNSFIKMGIISKSSYGACFFTEYGNALAEQYKKLYGTVKEHLTKAFPGVYDKELAVCSLLAVLPPDYLEALN